MFPPQNGASTPRSRAGTCGPIQGGGMNAPTNASWFDTVRRNASIAVGAVAACALFVTPAAAQGVIRDAEIEHTLRDYSAPLWVAAGLNPDDVSMYIIGDDEINAFVSGGQNIFVHTGLILAARTPNELKGVLAHETGHIAGGHLARSAEAQQQAMGPALIAIGLGVLAIAAGVPQAGAALISGSQAFAMGNYVRHTQVQESAADQAALAYLEETDQSAKGLIDFFNNNFRRYEFVMRRAPQYLLTHPYSSDRVEALRSGATVADHYNTTDGPEDLARFRTMQAKLIGFLQTQGQTLARYPVSDQSADARYARAIAYYRTAQMDLARTELTSLIAENPTNPYYQELMGQMLYESGRSAESVPYHRRSVELTHDEPLLMLNLARALADDRDTVDEAITLLNGVVRIEPLNSLAWSELAEARDFRGEQGLAELASAEANYARGNFPAALSFAERARRTLPRNTPSFQRASDIATFSGQEVRDMMEDNNGRRRS
ncbi:putative Zn-dependent protease [alpha proteobacterium U9-1i]|nr:putative Zn-dependent protease [alpha proteobacterium U9-1i]